MLRLLCHRAPRSIDPATCRSFIYRIATFYFETSEASIDTGFSLTKHDIFSEEIRYWDTPDMDQSSERRKGEYRQCSYNMNLVRPGNRLHELRLWCKGENAADPWGDGVQHVTSRNPRIERAQRYHRKEKHHYSKIVQGRIPGNSWSR